MWKLESGQTINVKAVEVLPAELENICHYKNNIQVGKCRGNEFSFLLMKHRLNERCQKQNIFKNKSRNQTSKTIKFSFNKIKLIQSQIE